MNVFQILMRWFLRWEYVVLIHHDGDRVVKRAYTLGGRVYANPHMPYTRTELLPGGKTRGQSYIDGWQPVTDKTFTLFDRDA